MAAALRSQARHLQPVPGLDQIWTCVSQISSSPAGTGPLTHLPSCSPGCGANLISHQSVRSGGIGMSLQSVHKPLDGQAHGYDLMIVTMRLRAKVFNGFESIHMGPIC